MGNKTRVVLLVVLVMCCSSCVSLNKGAKNDLNVLKAKVANLENSVAQLAAQNNQMSSVIAGEQQRGEYLQQQLAQTSTRTQGEIAGIESRVGSSRNSNGAVTDKYGKKFISEKMSVQPSVRDVQVALRNAGYYDGEVDGKPGSMTRKGVRDFQAANSLGSDGVVGEKTWDALKKFL